MGSSRDSASTVRVDKWLWAVRVYKTRNAAKSACVSGRVSIGGEVAKPASKVKVGDVVVARKRDHTIIYQVDAILEKRVSAALASECFVDHSEPRVRPVREVPPPGGARRPGEGRPTKRERRRLDRLRGIGNR